MLKIGITGGIGSGKSTVCAIFQILGIPVFNADIEARKLYDEPQVKEAITLAFGDNMYPQGLFDKKAMADLVFQSADKLKQLNDLLHPLVQIQFDTWLQQQVSPYIIKEAALLIEAGSYQQLDALMLVTCPINKRIERVMKRDRVTEDEVLARINKQLSEEDKRALCQYKIINDDKQLLIPQVLQLHHQLMRLAGQE
ncbi:MAG: dephospho-CoA kinase [Chitinophagaceae bacterium]|nr:dephospho-CoA kinase [Chitinophagaceae bacterium]